jgi:murein DD-endopeptidase MepM/ murein hydrolase activator NlpD
MKHALLSAAVSAGAILATLCSQNAAMAAQASAPPAFGWPFTTLYNVTAAFDLDPAATNRADWTGWRTGEPTAGNGHAYDGHGGHDFGLPTGTNITATAAARVYALRESAPNNDHSDTGNYLILDHKAATGTSVGGRDYRTRYWHLSQNGVIPSGTNVAVAKGSLVALSDNTGNSTGPHLHYGVSLLPADRLTCAFYHGWWEHDEFYTANTRPCVVYVDIGSEFLNCREGTSTAYNFITSFPPNAKAVATQQNTWWRVMLPLPPSKAYESRDSLGGPAAGYSDAGPWANSSVHSQVEEVPGSANYVTLAAAGSRVLSAGSAANTATFNFSVPFQRGDYDIYATWPSDANAANVTYRVSHSGGTTDVTVDQVGNTGWPGNGTKAQPYLINHNPYVVDHTTVGAPDEWNLYSPQGNTLPEEGPENLYRFDLRKPATVTITVEHSGYPGNDIDIHLLTAANPATCFQRANWTMTSSLAAGTYYIACDSYGAGAAGNAAAAPYKLTVEFPEDHPFPNSWVKLGRFGYVPDAAGSVQVRSETVTGPINPAQPLRIYADSIKVEPPITRRTGWISNGFATRINTAATPVASVVIKSDTTPDNDSNTMDAYTEVPIYRSPAPGTSNLSEIVGKAVTGQRFVCTGRAGDWYKVWLTNGTAATEGWLLGDHLIGYNLNFAAEVGDWQLY